MSDILLSSSQRRRGFPWFAALAVVCVALGVAGGWWWQSRVASSDPAGALDQQERAAIEAVVRDYILANPEILPEAMDRLQSKSATQQVADNRVALETPFPGAVLGNPQGKITLVEFTDYACGYCRQSVSDVQALIAEHPDLRVVVRELPILSPASTKAAEMALAAASQGKYAAYHDAMFAGSRPDATSIAAAARAAGIQPGAAAAGAGEELANNLDLARKLGINGTPAWVVGDRLLVGAVGREALEAAIAEAREKA